MTLVYDQMQNIEHYTLYKCYVHIRSYIYCKYLLNEVYFNNNEHSKSMTTCIS